MVSPRDLPALVQLACDAEQAGVDTVMLSEHVVLGPDSSAAGLMGNPRDYAAPGNQDPATPVAGLAGAGVCDRRPHEHASDCAGGGDRAAQAPAAAGQAAGHARSARAGPPGRPAHRQLERPRVRRSGRAVHPPRGDPGRAAGGDVGCLDGHARQPRRASTSRSATPTWSPSRTVPAAPRCGSAASACTSRCCGGSFATATASTRSARPRPRSWRRCASGCGPPGAIPTGWSWWAGSAAASPTTTRRPRSTRRSSRCRPSWPPDTPRSASSPRCTPTIRPP